MRCTRLSALHVKVSAGVKSTSYVPSVSFTVKEPLITHYYTLIALTFLPSPQLSAPPEHVKCPDVTLYNSNKAK